VLWVRSYGNPQDQVIFGEPSKSRVVFGIFSNWGAVHLCQTGPESISDWYVEYAKNKLFSFGVKTDRRSMCLRTPYYSLVVLAASFVGLPWFRYRFSLRTLLIATTLIAMVLGLIVWAVR
jgi:hypothetical protein